jgi:murein DD-endopeptidase MepM/ murein hydrolase activator NlpD
MKYILTFLLLSATVFSQNNYPKDYFSSPLEIPTQLSGNFGELRPNHFHAGFDYKTQKKEGLNVRSAAEGYVSRIKISTFGYGKAIYISHPNGYTTVYGHLSSLSPKIDSYLKAEQYKLKSYEVDLYLKPTDILISKSEIIALSGNTGGSEGPHLHFEFRDSKTEEIINPNLFGFDVDIKDTQKPAITNLYVYPIDENSVVNKSKNPYMINLSLQKDGNYNTDKILAKGLIGFGINTYDLSDLSWDRNGVYKVETFLNGKTIYGYQFDSYAFDQMRYVNALIDYERYKKTGQRVQKLFMKTPFPLSIINKYAENGKIDVSQNTNLTYRIEVSDFNSNKTIITIPIEYSNDAATDTLKVNKSKYLIKSDKEYNFEKGNWSFFVPKGTFYDDFYLNFEEKQNSLWLDNEYIPVHTNFLVSVIDSISSKEDKEKMFIGSIEDKKINFNYTKLKDNTFSTYTKNWGKFSLIKDTVAPSIKIAKSIEGKWISDKKSIEFTISDALSGIKSYDGYLNGSWILFEYDYKTKKIVHYFDDGVVAEGVNNLKVVVADNVGNSAIFETQFLRSQIKK